MDAFRFGFDSGIKTVVGATGVDDERKKRCWFCTKYATRGFIVHLLIYDDDYRDYEFPEDLPALPPKDPFVCMHCQFDLILNLYSDCAGNWIDKPPSRISM